METVSSIFSCCVMDVKKTGNVYGFSFLVRIKKELLIIS